VNYFVRRERGPRWNPGVGMREQEAWDEHATFMDALVDEGFVILGGPVGLEDGYTVFAVEAENEREVEERFAADPWSPMDILVTATIRPWRILLRAGSKT
jgi:uncharacterized protein YciI